MGCKESKTAEISKGNMVRPVPMTVKVPFQKASPGDGVLDEQCPIDIRQAFKIKQSWKAIRRNMDDTGIEMFMR